jgi:hypothetical protein
MYHAHIACGSLEVLRADITQNRKHTPYIYISKARRVRMYTTEAYYLKAENFIASQIFLPSPPRLGSSMQIGHKPTL